MGQSTYMDMIHSRDSNGNMGPVGELALALGVWLNYQFCQVLPLLPRADGQCRLGLPICTGVGGFYAAYPGTALGLFPDVIRRATIALLKRKKKKK